MRASLVYLLLGFALLNFAACGGTGNVGSPGGVPTSPSGPAGGGGGPSVSADHVFIVVLENHGFSQVIGNASMPYLNSLASQNALATNYFANTHPSIGNYFMLTVGMIETNDDDFSGTVTDDNIVRTLTAAGKSWKAYMEGLPSAGYTGGDVYPYAKHHDPFAYMSDVLNSPAHAAHIVPFGQLGADISAVALPSFGFIVPDLEHDAHDCPDGGATCTDADKLAAADNWLKANISSLINSPAFANGVLIITWDESVITDTANGGGHVATVILGSHVKPALQSNTVFQHPSVLRLALDLLKVNHLPNAAASAPPMSEFFQ
jgi:hypothetical protein